MNFGFFYQKFYSQIFESTVIVKNKKLDLKKKLISIRNFNLNSTKNI